MRRLPVERASGARRAGRELLAWLTDEVRRPSADLSGRCRAHRRGGAADVAQLCASCWGWCRQQRHRILFRAAPAAQGHGGACWRRHLPDRWRRPRLPHRTHRVWLLRLLEAARVGPPAFTSAACRCQGTRGGKVWRDATLAAVSTKQGRGGRQQGSQERPRSPVPRLWPLCARRCGSAGWSATGIAQGASARGHLFGGQVWRRWRPHRRRRWWWRC